MKKGIFFTLDAILGITLLFVGGFLAYFAFVQEPVVQPSLAYAQDVMAILATSRFRDMNMSLVASGIRLLVENGRIYDLDKTILAQVGEFYFLKTQAKENLLESGIMKTNIENLITAVTGGAIPRSYGWEVRIQPTGEKSEVLYSPKQGPAKDHAKINIVTQQLAFGTYKQRTPYGPYLVEVEVWG